MAARGGMPAGLVAKTLREPNGEPATTRPDEGRGGRSGRKGRSRRPGDEKGRPRNLVIPDSSMTALLSLRPQDEDQNQRRASRQWPRRR